MSINEVLRTQTLSARDKLRGLDEDIARAEAERNAAAERVKRATTEITKHKALESERKRSQGLTTEKLTEAQRIFEDLERKRQEALEALVRLQEELSVAEKARREAQKAIEAAITEVRREEAGRQEAESALTRALTAREEANRILRNALLRGLDFHLERQSGTVLSAFSTQKQKAKAMREAEAFRKARHSDPVIGKLCDERDEFRKLLGTAMVPGVKAMLQGSLNEIEQEIVKRFPGAFQMQESTSDNLIDELLFYCDKEGKAVFLLPISTVKWAALADVTTDETITKVACLAWNMIRELGLRPEDGDFRTISGRTVFTSELDIETVASQHFSVRSDGIEVIRFVLTPVPSELQEALTDEDPNY